MKSIPRGTNILRSKFVFDDKRGPEGQLLKFKARLVAMGFTQVEGVDYFDTFASVMTTKSFRTPCFVEFRNRPYDGTLDIKQATRH